MFAMFNRFFAMFDAFFGAAEKGANALNHLAAVGESKAKAFHDEEMIKINARLKKLQADSDKGTLLIEG